MSFVRGEHSLSNDIWQSNSVSLFRGIEQVDVDSQWQAEKEVAGKIKSIERVLGKYVIRGRRRILDTRRQRGHAELFRQILTEVGNPLHYAEIHEQRNSSSARRSWDSRKKRHMLLCFTIIISVLLARQYLD